ncbi:MAG: hypothetical protein AB8B58_20120 [Roseobacter sp.]
MTACWSKGKTKTYPYYLCDTHGCASKRKSIPRAKIEGGFSESLISMQPTSKVFELASAMFKDAWGQRLSQAEEAQGLFKKQLRDVEKPSEDVLDRIMEASSASVISAYEARFEKLERQKLVLAEKATSSLPKNGQRERFIEFALKSLSNPCNTCEK